MRRCHEAHATRLSSELVSLLSADKFDACRFVSTLDAYVEQKVAMGWPCIGRGWRDAQVLNFATSGPRASSRRGVAHAVERVVAG